MSTHHQIDATRSGTHETMGDWDVDYTITFSYSPSSREQGPSYASGGQPAEPAEVEFISIIPDAGDHGAFTDMAQQGLEQWAQSWLDDHYDECIDQAEAEIGPDPDYEYDRRIDDKLTGDE